MFYSLMSKKKGLRISKSRSYFWDSLLLADQKPAKTATG